MLAVRAVLALNLVALALALPKLLSRELEEVSAFRAVEDLHGDPLELAGLSAKDIAEGNAKESGNRRIHLGMPRENARRDYDDGSKRRLQGHAKTPSLMLTPELFLGFVRLASECGLLQLFPQAQDSLGNLVSPVTVEIFQKGKRRFFGLLTLRRQYFALLGSLYLVCHRYMVNQEAGFGRHDGSWSPAASSAVVTQRIQFVPEAALP